MEGAGDLTRSRTFPCVMPITLRTCGSGRGERAAAVAVELEAPPAATPESGPRRPISKTERITTPARQSSRTVQRAQTTLPGRKGFPTDTTKSAVPIPRQVAGGSPRTCLRRRGSVNRSEVALGRIRTAHETQASTANSLQSPGTPFNSCSPRSMKNMPDPATKSTTVRDTSTSSATC